MRGEIPPERRPAGRWWDGTARRRRPAQQGPWFRTGVRVGSARWCACC